MGVAGNIIATPLSKRLNNRYAIVAAIARGSRGVFLIGLGLAAGIVPAIILFWLVYLNAGLIGSPQRTLINNEIPSERRSTMLSVESLASYVGGFIGSVFLGYVAQHLSINIAWIIAGAISLVSLFLYIGVDRRQQRKNYDQSEPLLNPSKETAAL